MFGKGKGNGLGGLMQQAQQMQEKMQKMQEEVAKSEVIGESGAGLVRVKMNGEHSCLGIQIDESLLRETIDKSLLDGAINEHLLDEAKGLLEDLIAAAFNNAVSRIGVIREEKMASISAGVGLPPGFKMPF